MMRPLYRIVPAVLALAACATTGGQRTAANAAANVADNAHAAPAHDHAAHAGRAPAAAPATDDRQHAHHAAHGHDMHGLTATAGAGFTEADAHFMQMMIVHHAQALTMAELAPVRGAGPEVLALARKIDISQRDEIAMMKQWLIERGQAVPDSNQLRTITMAGMLTPTQLDELAAARGASFDRLFLTLMIQHHLGALVMTDALFASPGAAQDPDIFRFATDVAADQLDEIGIMEHLLDVLDATSRSESS